MRRYIDTISWSYQGNNGPEHWHELNQECSVAKYGNEQSPINIVTDQLQSEQRVKPAELCYTETVYHVENTGHTIQLVPQNNDNYIVIDQEEYRLNQLHFHRPSEHQLDGKGTEMEAHFVHRNAQGAIAVLGLFLIEGRENELLREAFSNFPSSKSQPNELVPLKQPVNMKDLFLDNNCVYRYSGSLTTPPCSEGVKWNIFQQPVEISSEQIEQFRQVYGNCNRPLQELNDRICYVCTSF